MSERNNPSSYSSKVVDLKPRGDGRTPHSQFGHFSPDEDLLQSTARIKTQRDVIRERLQKMNQAHTRVSKSVYEKVRRDYTLQLETINELLLEKKQLLKEEIKKLYINREKLSFEINRHREILEEAEFRHFLGEFTQSQYQEVENFETKEIEKLESDLSHISQWIRTHEDLFDPEDFGHKKPEPQPKTETTVTVEAPRSAPTQSAPTPPVQAKPVPAPLPQAEPQPQPQSAPVAPQAKASEPITTSLPPAVPQQPQTPAPQIIEAQPEPSQTATEHTEQAEASFQHEEHAPSSAATLTSEIEPQEDDFSQLLDSSEESASDFFGSTENNIQALLRDAPKVGEEEETTPLKARVEVQPEPTVPEPEIEATPSAEQDVESELSLPEPVEDDYFRQDKVNESSFHMARSEEESVTASRQASAAQQTQTPVVQPQAPLPPSGLSATDRKVLTPDSAKPVSRDDSISNILDSIRLDDEDASPSADIAVASAAIQTEFKLLLLQGDLDDRVFAVKDNTAIGRSPSNDVILKEPKVSRQHAAINKYNEHYILIDLKSSNGVYVNGAKVDECVLHPGDEISIGGYKFQFQKT